MQEIVIGEANEIARAVVFLASDDVQIAVASFMVSITRVFAAGILMLLVNTLLPSFLNLSAEERTASLAARNLSLKSCGLFLTFCGGGMPTQDECLPHNYILQKQLCLPKTIAH